MTEETGPDRELRTIELRVPAMDCASCASTIEDRVGSLEGVNRVDPRVTAGIVAVTYDPEQASAEVIESRIEGAGYSIVTDDRERTLAVSDMDCPSCASKVERALEPVPGVDSVATQPTARRVFLEVDPAVPDRDLEEAVAGAGYDATVLDEGSHELDEDPIWRSRRAIRTAVGGLIAAVGILVAFVGAVPDPTVGTLGPRLFSLSQVLFIASAAVPGAAILRDGYYSARSRSLDIDLLMSIGIVAAIAAHHPFEAAMLAVLFSVAELLERYSMDRARSSIRSLMDLSPATATVKDGEAERTVPVEELEIGDRVIVRPGEKIPVDGVVQTGSSAVDQSPITGESTPVDRAEGDEVYAGTITESGYLEVEVTTDPGNSTIDRIVELVEAAESTPTDREQFIDRFAAVYTPVVVLLAILLAVGPPLILSGNWNTWFLRGLTLLVIACPCALVISTPVSVVSGITSAARNGVLVKGGRYLEAVGESAVVAMDKTGTLTRGELSVTDVVAFDGATEAEVLARAGAVEQRSEHPIAEAIVTYANERGLLGDAAVAEFTAVPGRGVRATVDGNETLVGAPSLFGDQIDLSHRHLTDGGSVAADPTSQCGEPGCVDVLDEIVPALESAGKSVVLVGTPESVSGVIGVADTVRDAAADTVDRLQTLGVRVVMLTGDNEGTARAIGDSVGVDEVHAELLPEDKLDAIREMEETEGPVAMVGDGVNDAPALATASVGIAMGAAGTDAAIETADVALMGDDIALLPYLYRLSRRSTRVIRENIWASLLVKGVLALGAPFGIVTVIHAVIIGDMGMSLGVTGNAMRLGSVDPDE